MATKKCKVCGEMFRIKRSTTEMFCSFKCANTYTKNQPLNKRKKKPIKTVSDKRTALNRQYRNDRAEFLDEPQNRFCFVNECNRRATTIEHIKGRVGYADDWARKNDVPLLLDQRYWRPCCLEHNLEFERNPEMSKKYQLSKLHNGRKF